MSSRRIGFIRQIPSATRKTGSKIRDRNFYSQEPQPNDFVFKDQNIVLHDSKPQLRKIQKRLPEYPYHKHRCQSYKFQRAGQVGNKRSEYFDKFAEYDMGLQYHRYDSKNGNEYSASHFPPYHSCCLEDIHDEQSLERFNNRFTRGVAAPSYDNNLKMIHRYERKHSRRQLAQVYQIQDKLCHIDYLDKKYRKQQQRVKRSQRKTVIQDQQHIDQICATVPHKYGHLMLENNRNRNNSQDKRIRYLEDAYYGPHDGYPILQSENKSIPHPHSHKSQQYLQDGFGQQPVLSAYEPSQKSHLKPLHVGHNMRKAVTKTSDRSTGMFKTKGGICFEIDTKLFAIENKKKQNRKAKEYIEKIFQKNAQSFTSNSKEQLHKRRKNAKLYGKWVRDNIAIDKMW